MNIGDCFMMPVPPKYDVPHLWIVISSPDSKGYVVIVNVTHDWQRAGKEYILPAACHRRVPDESFVNFPDALAVDPRAIRRLVGTLVTLEAGFEAAHVAGIIAVGKTSRSMSNDLKAIL